MSRSLATSGGSRLLQNGLKLLLLGAALVMWRLQATHHRSRLGPRAEPAANEPLKLQEVRAAEPMRGRNAVAPWQIPWLGWKDVLWRTYQQIDEDRVLAVAAGVVFFALLAFFPAVTAFVSLYGLFADPSTVNQHLSMAASVMPAAAFDILREQIDRIVAKGNATLSLAFIFSFGFALWSANAGMKAVIDALNIAYEETEKRGFFHLNLISLCLTVGAITALLLAVGAVVVFPLVLSQFGLAAHVETIIEYARWPALFAVLMAGMATLYRYGPSRNDARWEWVSLGSVVATIAWLAGSMILSWYLKEFADYNATYGSLGAGIGFMTWLWLSSCVIILGAELNSEIEHQTARDSTVGPEKPLGARGATMADTVGEAQVSQ
jgi:membrane protein